MKLLIYFWFALYDVDNGMYRTRVSLYKMYRVKTDYAISVVRFVVQSNDELQ